MKESVLTSYLGILGFTYYTCVAAHAHREKERKREGKSKQTSVILKITQENRDKKLTLFYR